MLNNIFFIKQYNKIQSNVKLTSTTKQTQVYIIYFPNILKNIFRRFVKIIVKQLLTVTCIYCKF